MPPTSTRSPASLRATLDSTCPGADHRSAPWRSADPWSRPMPATTTPQGVSLNYDTFGDPGHPAMVLIQGLGAHMLGWREELCWQLADRCFHVIRFDNRDVGL